MNYDNIQDVVYDTNCTETTPHNWERLMEGAVKANKKKINSIVKRLLPSLWEELGLKYYNPYSYKRSRTHLILVHSAIEYFIKYR